MATLVEIMRGMVSKRLALDLYFLGLFLLNILHVRASISPTSWVNRESLSCVILSPSRCSKQNLAKFGLVQIIGKRHSIALHAILVFAKSLAANCLDQGRKEA